MRNLRHPITMFVVGILAVIGVGVALVSGLPNAPAQRTYGSAPLRFEAAFPGAVGQPVVRVPDYGLVFTLACSNTDLISIDGVDMSAVSSNGGGYFRVAPCRLQRLELPLTPLEALSLRRASTRR